MPPRVRFDRTGTSSRCEADSGGSSHPATARRPAGPLFFDFDFDFDFEQASSSSSSSRGRTLEAGEKGGGRPLCGETRGGRR